MDHYLRCLIPPDDELYAKITKKIGSILECSLCKFSNWETALVNIALGFQRPAVRIDKSDIFNPEAPLMFQTVVDFLICRRDECLCFKEFMESICCFSSRQICYKNAVFSVSYLSCNILERFLLAINRITCCEAISVVEEIFALSFRNFVTMRVQQVALDRPSLIQENNRNLAEYVQWTLRKYGKCCSEVQNANLKYFQRFVVFSEVSTLIEVQSIYNRAINDFLRIYFDDLRKLDCCSSVQDLSKAAIVSTEAILYVVQKDHLCSLYEIQSDFTKYFLKLQNGCEKKFSVCLPEVKYRGPTPPCVREMTPDDLEKLWKLREWV